MVEYKLYTIVCSRSLKNLKFCHFTLSFCRRWRRNVLKRITHMDREWTFFAHWTFFCDVHVTVAIVIQNKRERDNSVHKIKIFFKKTTPPEARLQPSTLISDICAILLPLKDLLLLPLPLDEHEITGNKWKMRWFYWYIRGYYLHTGSPHIWLLFGVFIRVKLMRGLEQKNRKV